MLKLRLSIAVLAGVAGILATAPASLADAPAFSESQICKGAIGAIMGQDPETINVTKNEEGIVYLHYVRADDGSNWAYRCKLDGSKLIWASDTGRWRNGPADETITYKVTGSTLEIVQTFTDGSASTATYNVSQLGK